MAVFIGSSAAQPLVRNDAAAATAATAARKKHHTLTSAKEATLSQCTVLLHLGLGGSHGVPERHKGNAKHALL